MQLFNIALWSLVTYSLTVRSQRLHCQLHLHEESPFATSRENCRKRAIGAVRCRSLQIRKGADMRQSR